MKHSELTYLLPDFVNDKLNLDEQQIVAEHLSTCVECQQEVSALRSLMSSLKTESVHTPSSQYWSSVLPRIHERIERTSSQQIPEWLLRYVMPLSATAVLVLFVINFKSSNGVSDIPELPSMLQQLSTEELHSVTETVTSPGFRETYIEHKDIAVSLTDDGEVLTSLVQDDTDFTTHADFNIDAAVEKLSEHDADDLIAALEQTVPKK